MDLNVRANLSTAESFRIATHLHTVLLEETFRVTRWKNKDAVFHGGTSLKLAYDSLRLSEDLDFMISPTAHSSLLSAAKPVADKTRLIMKAHYPDCQIDFKVRQSQPGQSSVDVWDVRWTHPNRRGKVLVKMEFFRVDQDLLSEYSARMMATLSGGEALRITTPVPVAEIAALWSDKVKAIATRPAFKYRDAFDLAFIANRLSVSGTYPDDAKLTDNLLRASSIYGKTPSDIVKGLQQYLEAGHFEDVSAFRENMRHWFDADVYHSYDEAGLFESMLYSARSEVEKGCRLLEEHLENSIAAGLKM
ncbi:nucleotidyl transferase AbiEii/AbiGii toxin family protein [Thalassospira xiamenensis]|uniref:Nucleotidyl transferase AbiEii toxin, Type IV TA system n=1 Tax=Thalassospira xiamenensis TaxID=220697 RepID=A0A285TTJ8_9PROT|nr:nucleotidyl transferase AbiEii/AbiGii toxin family protein [Thalassospira xiamenensis]SOC27398.1 Nucleotidyl transferase AbiEii toxin, Type IV TA system [Thalassospira xiamenensis]